MLDIAIEGVGLYAPGLPNWLTARDALSGAHAGIDDAMTAPAPSLLAANERRRAPESVLLALAVAEQACAMAQRDPRELPNVFASSYGDLAINDYLCAVLARAPLELSPTKFHNSVHNAPAGYWSIATRCMATSSALSAGAATFAAGLFEAALLAHSEATPVLFAACDVAACGPLADVIPARIPFGVAFVLAPGAMPSITLAQVARLRLTLADAVAAELAPLPAHLHALQVANPIAASLPVLVALARRTAATLGVALTPYSTLHMEISF
jgi:hypothetical protein